MFNNLFFKGSTNILTDLLPESGEFENVVHVIDVPKIADGAYARVVADPQSHSAICFLG
jgi:hypothetical protein